MLHELQQYGLSENEAKVYFASLEIGKATADELAKHAEIKRPTTYVQIESLSKKGLISTYEEGKKTYFVPESPLHLKRILNTAQQELEQKERSLANFLPTLENLFAHSGDRPRVRFFNGKEGIITMRKEILEVKSKELCIIFSQDALAEIFSKKELGAYSNERAQRGIKSKAIYTRKEGKFEEAHPPLTERRFMPSDKLPLGTDIIVYDNKVAIMALRGKLFGVIIEGEEIAKSIKSLFTILWEVAEKFQH